MFKKDKTIAEHAFVTQRPRNIYKTTKITVDAMFGVTSLVSFGAYESHCVREKRKFTTFALGKLDSIDPRACQRLVCANER